MSADELPSFMPPRPAEVKVNAGHILLGLARYFNWFQVRMLPEFEVDGGRADLAILSRSGYITEIEIKVSLSDWNADREKDKFKTRRPHVRRFFYAVPRALAEKIPDWVPPEAGILTVHAFETGYPHVRELRPAKALKAEKLPKDRAEALIEACYYRFWRLNLQALEKKVVDRKPKVVPIVQSPGKATPRLVRSEAA